MPRATLQRTRVGYCGRPARGGGCVRVSSHRPGNGTEWPELEFTAWSPTRQTLHMWTQVVGKVRLAFAPRINHWWQVALYLTGRGLTTSPVFLGTRPFEIEFDFVEHRLIITSESKGATSFPFEAQSVATFYQQTTEALREHDLDVAIWTTPVEVESPVAFERDTAPGAYDPDAVSRFWRALLQSYRVMTAFRADFLGKVSPVHFFWGSFDLAVTRFSGRLAPAHPGVPGMPLHIVREAYSHEVSSAGFWPGDARFPTAAFYSYAYPSPSGFADQQAGPAGASFHPQLGEFVLPYDAVRRADDPDAALLSFLRSTYDAAATLGRWDRSSLER